MKSQKETREETQPGGEMMRPILRKRLPPTPCLCLCLCFLLSALAPPARAQEGAREPIAWGDPAKTRFSSGTGGTVPRPLLRTDAFAQYPSEQEFFESAPAPAQDFYRGWVEDTRRAAQATLGAEADVDFNITSEGDGELWCFKARVKTSSWGFAAFANTVFDGAQARQLALSDLFYDGFNYIDYINQYIAATSMDHAEEYEFMTERIEYSDRPMLKRPFAGFFL
jgi:hypothetical protein